MTPRFGWRWALVVVALGSAACGPAPEERAAAPALEVRGAPIASAPQASQPAREAEPAVAAEEEPAAPDSGEERPQEGATNAGEDLVPTGHVAGAHAQADELEERQGGKRELKVVGGTTLLTFADLAFAKGDTITRGDKVIPEAVQALDGQRVAVDGFMIPMDFEEDGVRSLLLTSFPPGCCFGMLPAMDQWIDVEMVSEEGAEVVEMRIVRVTGTLEVGEVLDDFGYLTSIYRMDADSLVSQW